MGNSSANHDFQHWEIQELLGRYAELIKAKEDVEYMYPAVAEHLLECDECQSILDDLLEPHSDIPVDSKITGEKLDFLQPSHPMTIVLARKSSISITRKIHIAFPANMLPGSPFTSQVMRGFAPIQPGGRLILFTSIPFDNQEEFIVMLTLHDSEEAECYTVVGELTGEPLPIITEALLHVGQHTYSATINHGQLQFTNVRYDNSVNQVSLTIDTTLPSSRHH
jgi:hypothetical protein